MPKEVEKNKDKEKENSGKPDDDSKKSGGAKKEFTNEQVLTAVVALGQQFKTFKESVEDEIKTLKKGSDKPKDKSDAATPPTASEATLDDAKLETMSRRQLVDLILGRVGKVVEEKIKPIGESLETTREETLRNDLKAQLKDASEKYEDFWSFRDETQAILKRHPDLSIEDAYHLAKSGNPEKVAKLEDERKVKEEEDRKDSKRDKESSKFGGFLPTSGVTRRSEQMSPEEAAEAAWEEVGLDEHTAALQS